MCSQYINYLIFREADSAIIGLDGKPPLYWKVGYSLDHSICWRDPQYFDQYDAPMLPPQRAVQLSVVPFTRAVVPFHNRGNVLHHKI